MLYFTQQVRGAIILFQEVDDILHAVSLVDKANDLASTLSGESK